MGPRPRPFQSLEGPHSSRDRSWGNQFISLTLDFRTSPVTLPVAHSPPATLEHCSFPPSPVTLPLRGCLRSFSFCLEPSSSR